MLNLSYRTMLKDIRARKACIKHAAYLTQKQSAEASDRAKEYLAAYEKDILNIAAKDYKIFAEYIMIFAGDRQKKLLDKLQTHALFDVKEYLTTARIVNYGLSQDRENSLKTSELRQAIAAYNLLFHKQKNGKLNREEAQKMRDITASAKNHVNNFLSGKLIIYADDVRLFKRYITTTLPSPTAQKALAKLATGDFAVREHETRKSSTEKIAEKILMKLSAFKNRYG